MMAPKNKNAFVFSQPDLLTSSFSAFYDMKKSKELSDVTIRIQNREIAAHRIILAAAIPYFRTMFTGKLAESYNKEVTVKELDPDALESLINFAYTSKVKITAKNVQSILVASSFLHVTQVRDSCCDFLSKRLDPNNVMSIRNLADSLNCLILVKNANSYIEKNFEAFCQTKDFFSLSLTVLKDLIRKDDLHVSSEERVFDAVMSWVKTDARRRKMLPSLLSEVRMTFLTPEFLINNASKEKLIMDSVACRNLLDEAKHYHLLPEGSASLSSFTVSERCYGHREGRGIYLFCCSKSNGLTIFRFVDDTGKWDTILNDKSRPDLKHVLPLGDEIYVFSGKTFETFNPQTLEWTPKTKFPGTYSSFKHAVPCNGKIFWFGNSESECQGIWFDTQRNQWLKFMHPDLCIYSGDQLVPFGNVIYIFGWHPRHQATGRRNEMYDLQTQTVSEMPEMKNERWKFGSAVLGNKLYVCGGITNFRDGVNWRHTSKSSLRGSVLNNTEIYTPSQGWREVSAMNTTRKNFSLLTYNKKLYAIGGITDTSPGIEWYDPATDKWAFAGSFVDGQHDFVKAVVLSRKN